ncbi:tRNA(fMet)-specific endonuclease VapC [uncultured archaeon]|nr:tRNA(fMet)-specific endonuclease VapC [uncultured archaeon]
MAILDTSIIIDFLSGDEGIISRVHELARNGKLRTTTITEYELLKHKNELKKDFAKKLLMTLEICPFDRRAATEAALVFAELSKKGKMINENDILIIGISSANGDLLVTRDQKFKNITGRDIEII